MKDTRSLYINQIINHYRISALDDNEYYNVRYVLPGVNKQSYRLLSHNEGLDVVRDYIKDLEKKVSELQYVERIIKVAKENNYELNPNKQTN